MKIKENLIKKKLNSLGFKLIKARKLMSLSKKDISNKLCLNIKIINFIEKDLIPDNLPPVFFIGYIKLYSKLVNLSLDDFLLNFNKINDDYFYYLKIKVKKIKLNNNKNYKLLFFLFLILIFLILFILNKIFFFKYR